MNDKKLVNLVESTNRELQEKQLNILKAEGFKRLEKLEESLKKMEEGFGRGVVGRQMGALPTSHESKLYRLGKMLQVLVDDGEGESEEAKNIRQQMDALNDRIDSSGKGPSGSGSSLLAPEGDSEDPHSADHISLGAGRAPFVSAGGQRRAASKSIANKVDRPLSTQLGLRSSNDLSSQIQMARIDLMKAKSPEAAKKIVDRIKDLETQRDEFISSNSGE